ncbi:MAG TPA: dihydrolipoamide dehydrogenase, partial [Bifidobacterium sp.]|nr:dihydrolipoamide dehydrogenase [Bifidobacterium sp.]
ITAGHALAHRAFEQGIVIAESIAGLDPKPVLEETVPQVVFSFPEAACVGLTFDEAKLRDDIVDPKETAYPMLSNSRMLMSGEGGSMTIVSGAYTSDPETELVLGVHIVSPIASDLIAEAEQLVGNHVPLADAARLIHPHPTFSEALGEGLLKADGRPLHTR